MKMPEIFLYSSLKHEFFVTKYTSGLSFLGGSNRPGQTLILFPKSGSLKARLSSSTSAVGRALRSGDAVDRKVEFLGLLRTLV